MSPGTCGHCQLPFSPELKRVGGISVFVYGDECIYSYFRCPNCDWFTIEEYYDAFMGDSTVRWGPTVPASVGQAVLAWIAKCPEPHDKWCECAAHKALATGLPG